MEDENSLVEEVYSIELQDCELSEFEETKPLEVVAFLDVNTQTTIAKDKDANESALITKFMRGEGDLPDLYPKIETHEEQEEDYTIITYSDGVKSVYSQEGKYIDTEPAATSSQNQRDKNRRPARGVLNPALKGLMGEANLCFAQNQKEKAEKICMEIIRQNPLAPEPFLTLAQIYENRDHEKYMSFHIIAAHLMPHNREQWIHVANLHISSGDLQKARVYYSKAISILPKCYDLRMRKARLLERMGNINGAMFAYLRMLPFVPKEHGMFCLQTAKTVAQHFHSCSKPKFSLEAMHTAYQVCPELFTMQDLNLYFELLILLKNYARVVQCLIDHIHMQVECREENNLQTITLCIIPDDLVPEVRSKLMVSLIHLQATPMIEPLIDNAQQHIPLNETELYIDIAEALMQMQKYVQAIRLLTPLIQSLECPAFVWLRYADSYRYLNRNNEAIDSYYSVIKLAPNCTEAKFTLAALLKQQGRFAQALDALQQAHDSEEPLNVRMLYERCNILLEMLRIDEYLETGYLMLSRQSIKFRTRNELLAAANSGKFFLTTDGLRALFSMRSIAEAHDDQTFEEFTKIPPEECDLSLETEYEFFKELLNIAWQHGKYSFIERTLFCMVTSKRFAVYHADLFRIIILACYFNEDNAAAFSYLRDQLSRNEGNMSLWNMLSLLIQKSQDLRYHRNIQRFMQSHSCDTQIRMFLAHYHLHCSSFKYALLHYIPLHRDHQHPLATLCIAAIFNQLSLQKKVLRKTAAVSQSIAFAHAYAQLRCGRADWENEKNDTLPVHQEIYYNIGRIYQQAGVNHLSVYYYERALAVKHDLLEQHADELSLEQEIAYNLHLIYRASGNFHKARHYLYKYCVI